MARISPRAGVRSRSKPPVTLPSVAGVEPPPTLSELFVTVESGDGIVAVDISSPAALAELDALSGVTNLDGAFGLYTDGDFAYVAASQIDQLTVVDKSTPGALSLRGNLSDATMDFPRDAVLVSPNIWIPASTADSITGIDISDPDAPSLTGQIVDATNLDFTYDVEVDPNDLSRIHAAGSHGYTNIDISTPGSPTVDGVLLSGDSADMSFPRGLALGNGHAFVMSFLGDSVVVIDISNPSSPVEVGSVVDATNLDGAHGAVFHNDLLYVAVQGPADLGRLTVVDVSDPAAPTIHGTVSSANLDGAHRVILSGSHAYVACTNSDMLVSIDVSDPTTPTIADSLLLSLAGARDVHG